MTILYAELISRFIWVNVSHCLLWQIPIAITQPEHVDPTQVKTADLRFGLHPLGSVLVIEVSFRQGLNRHCILSSFFADLFLAFSTILNRLL